MGGALAPLYIGGASSRAMPNPARSAGCIGAALWPREAGRPAARGARRASPPALARRRAPCPAAPSLVQGLGPAPDIGPPGHETERREEAAMSTQIVPADQILPIKLHLISLTGRPIFPGDLHAVPAQRSRRRQDRRDGPGGHGPRGAAAHQGRREPQGRAQRPVPGGDRSQDRAQDQPARRRHQRLYPDGQALPRHEVPVRDRASLGRRRVPGGREPRHASRSRRSPGR